MTEPEQDYVIDPDGLNDIASSLLDGWEARPDGSLEMGQRGRRPDEGRFLAVFGLVSHVHRLGRRVLDLRTQDLLLEAVPLIRLMWESSLTAMWLAQNPDGGGAFANEEVRQRRAAVATMAKTSSPSMQRSAAQDEFPGFTSEPFGTSSDQQARAFEALCNDLEPGGANAYIHYRLMSRYCHAGVYLVEQYLLANETKEEVEAVSPNPSPLSDVGIWLFYVAASLVWAGTAMDYLDPARSRRSELRDAARSVGVERDLHLSAVAQRRIAEAEKTRRRGRWRGKRSRKGE